jgi:hypothetical protein
MMKPRINTMGELSVATCRGRPFALFFRIRAALKRRPSKRIEEVWSGLSMFRNFATRMNRKSTDIIGVIIPT